MDMQPSSVFYVGQDGSMEQVDWRVEYGFEPCKKNMPVYAEYGWWKNFDGNFEDDTLYRCDKFCWGEELSGKVIKAPKKTRSGKCY